MTVYLLLKYMKNKMALFIYLSNKIIMKNMLKEFKCMFCLSKWNQIIETINLSLFSYNSKINKIFLKLFKLNLPIDSWKSKYNILKKTITIEFCLKFE